MSLSSHFKSITLAVSVITSPLTFAEEKPVQLDAKQQKSLELLTLDAAREGDVETISSYLESGFSPNILSRRGDSLLILATYYGHAEVVARPKVITADKSAAKIESGVEIPFQEASSSGATSVSFKEAVLSLEVTPQITPDERIIMDLKVNQDTVGQVFAGVPSINTNEITTQVLVDNGQTIVLGGIFSTDRNTTITKTPFLGDLPYIGRLFRRTLENDNKQELLIFITPRVIQDSVAGR